VRVLLSGCARLLDNAAASNSRWRAFRAKDVRFGLRQDTRGKTTARPARVRVRTAGQRHDRNISPNNSASACSCRTTNRAMVHQAAVTTARAVGHVLAAVSLNRPRRLLMTAVPTDRRCSAAL
jgi:hypothetical protein